jgi:tRNA (adenine57-N1/adenine58-N1)-methyltransferase catalytic subunit
MIKNALLVSIANNNKQFLVRSEGELHTDAGIINLETLKTLEYGSIVATHLGYEFKVLEPRAPDYFRHLKRTGAPMMPKDIGIIVAHTGLNKDDLVLDAGTGSGITAIFLGNIAKRVVSYEINHDFAKRAAENVKRVGLTNVDIVEGDILEIASEMEFDVITLDLCEIGSAIRVVKDCLAPGGFIASFSPFYEQAFEARNALASFTQVTTFEGIEREMQFGKRGTRPATRVGHTGFVTIARA